MSAGLTPLEEDLLAALDPGEIATYAAGLTAALAEPGRDRTTAFIRAKLRSWRIPTAVERLDMLVSQPGTAYLSLAGREAPITAQTLPYSPATPAAGIVAELHAATPTTATDPQLRQRIALVDGPPDPATAAQLAAQGALAQIYISTNETLKATAIPNPWGGPAPTPAIVIGRAAGEGFLALCAAGPTPVRLAVAAAWTTRRLTMPVATINGAEGNDETLLIGIHNAGIDDHGEAAASLLELCRLYASQQPRLRRTIRCLWWPDGQSPAASAAWYTDQHWQTLRQQIVTYVELHPSRRRGRKGLPAEGDPALQPFADLALRASGLRAPVWAVPSVPTSITPFARLGIPIARLAAAQPNVIGLAIPLLTRLATTPLLPQIPLLTARLVAERIGEVCDTAGERLDFSQLREAATAFHTATEQVQIALLHIAQGDSANYEEGLRLANRLLQQLGQVLTPTLWHPGDPYILPPNNPSLLPGLDTLLPYLQSDGSDIAETVALRATALRERNRASDALTAATAAITETLATLRPLGFG